MPRKVVKLEPRQPNSVFAALYAQTEVIPLYTVEDWDPNTALLWEAIARAVVHGGQVVIRAGSGGQSLGISIWSNDTRPPAVYLNDEEGLAKWASSLLQLVPTRKRVVGEEEAR